MSYARWCSPEMKEAYDRRLKEAWDESPTMREISPEGPPTWQDPSDVYVFHNTRGFLECCGCIRSESSRSWLTKSRSAMVKHLIDDHLTHGDAVPQSCLDQLNHEIETEGDKIENHQNRSSRA